MRDSTLNFVAHADDDLLFMGVAIIRDVEAGRRVRTVYVTAGDDDRPSWYWRSRQAGVKAAYAEIAGERNRWLSSDADVLGHQIEFETLQANPSVSLAFMHLPDGGIEGTGGPRNEYQSLQKLIEGRIPAIATVDRSSTYTLDSLRYVLLALVKDFEPSQINVLDFAGCYGDGDHSDHHAVASLALDAQSGYSPTHGLTAYQGYPTAERPSNLAGPYLDRKRRAFYAYGHYDVLTCDSDESCALRPEGQWLSRQYTIAGGTECGAPAATECPK